MMKQLLRAGTLTALLVLTACASLPSKTEMEANTQGYKLPYTPKSNHALVYVVRPSGVGTLVRFNVFVDSRDKESEVGYTRGSQYIYFNVTPGEHLVESLAENWASLKLNTKAGETHFIKQDVSMGLVMARNSLSTIDQVEGTYHVKNSSIGTIKKDTAIPAPVPSAPK